MIQALEQTPLSFSPNLFLALLAHGVKATMPIAVDRQTSPPSLDQIHQILQQSLQRHDPSEAQQYLQQAKLALLKNNALIPSPQTPAKTLATARSILEYGALLSIRSKDPQSFVKYYSQLQPFYDFHELQKSPSSERSKITGLYLLLLLSQGDYAGFHTLLESLIVAEGDSPGGKNVEEDPYIQYPIELERSLMEGSYDQVWHKTKGREVPGEEFALFSDVGDSIFFLFSPSQSMSNITNHFRSSLTLSVSRLPVALLAPTHLFPSLLPRTYSFSTPKAPSSTLPTTKAGVWTTVESTSPAWKTARRPKRAIREKPSVTWSAMLGIWK